MIKLSWIKSKVKKEKYFFSFHGDKERMADNLLISEIETALLKGQILEAYPDTGRGESCLVVGYSDSGKPIHIVCGKKNNELCIITTYIPKAPKFKNPYERSE
ncbi:MAG: DUF4258 domain-containing protein [Spirochaetia bacterium]|nr:DUF4258 domain-containing protein [Spirochaetia bacterium]